MNYDLPFTSTTRSSSLKTLPPLDVELNEESLQNNLQHQASNHSLTKSLKLLPPLNYGLATVNNMRDQESLFRHEDHLIDKKSLI